MWKGEVKINVWKNWFSQKNFFAVGFVVDIPNHKIKEYDIVAGELVDPLYRLPSECVTVLGTIWQTRRKLSTT